MEAELKSNLLAVGALFASATGLAPSTVGMRVARDARFFDRLNDGKGFTVKTYDSVLCWFSENWPQGIAWPVDVPRPTRSRSGQAA